MLPSEAPLTQSPIHKALSSIRGSGVKALLMGGQACVFYGAAEFSRDLDLLPLGAENLMRFQKALADLEAECIAVPPLEARHLRRGHAAHFRCRRRDVAGLRIDVMSRLRGVASFEELWARRTTLALAGQPVDLLGLEDLVLAKKTQRDKDWPMLRRLVDRRILAARAAHAGVADRRRPLPPSAREPDGRRSARDHSRIGWRFGRGGSSAGRRATPGALP